CQSGVLYRLAARAPCGVAAGSVLQGKELSYNNLLDAEAAWDLILEFDRPPAAVVKHTNPCGVPQSGNLEAAYVQARECDPVSAFGSVVALNGEVDGATATELASTFVEVILAPAFSDEALATLTQQKNLRLLRIGTRDTSSMRLRQISGGFLIQDRDLFTTGPQALETVTKRAPTAEEMEALLFGWRVVKHVKSNAVVFSNGQRTLGIGAGQMS